MAGELRDDITEAFGIKLDNDARNRYYCDLFLDEFNMEFTGCGKSKKEARMNAAREAYEYLDAENELILPIDEVGEPDFDRAINQLQELYQKGYIGKPEYSFSERYDGEGNPEWACQCFVSNYEGWECISSSKKNGKKLVAYKMLCEVLGYESEDET